MDQTYVTLAVSATIAVGVAVLVRRRGWGMAIPLIAVGAFIGWLPIGPSAPPDPEIILVAILSPLVFGEALSSSYLDLRRVSRPVLALAIGLVVATTFVIGALGAVLVAMPVAMAMALGAVLAPTDAVAVSAVARRAGLPRRLVSILEGESLVNDGTGDLRGQLWTDRHDVHHRFFGGPCRHECGGQLHRQQRLIHGAQLVPGFRHPGNRSRRYHPRAVAGHRLATASVAN